MEKASSNPDLNKVKTITEASVSQESFNFMDAVMDRGYPEIEVPVYLDEKTVRELLDIEKERDELEVLLAKTQSPLPEHAEKFEELDNKYHELADSLRRQRFLVRVKGISPEEMVKIEESTYEQIPIEYEEDINPVTGAKTKKEVGEPNEEREELFAMLLRQALIVSVTAPNGAVDSDFSDLDKLRGVWSRLPLVARIKIDEAINETTIAVDYYRNLVDEVF